jgi:16S rRNA processing protein RimM
LTSRGRIEHPRSGVTAQGVGGSAPVAGRPFADLVSIGRLLKPQGRKGELLTEPFSDRPERFPGLRRAFVEASAGGSREVKITDCWPHKGRFVLKLEGVDSIDEAEALRGLEIRIGEEELAPLPQGSYYHHQLRGLRVELASGESVGVVADLIETTGGVPVLVVRGAEGETLIPLAEAFVHAVEPEAGRMVVELPELAEEAKNPKLTPGSPADRPRC